MMPYVHFRIVEKVFERAVAQVEIGMIQMADCDSKIKYNEGLLWSETTEEHDHDVFHRSIEYILHPVISKMSCKPHFLYGMMQLMESP